MSLQDSRNADKAIYSQVANELSRGERDEALWTQAFAEQGGNETAAKAMYIRLRVEELRSNAPSASTEPQSDPIDSPRSSGAWDRFFARHLDLLIATCISVPVFVLATGFFAHANVGTPARLILGIAWIIMIVFMPAVVDGAIVAIFGNSLGKKLWGIKVTGQNGRRLTFNELISRNGAVIVKGMWLGVLPLSLIGQHLARRRLETTGKTQWDERGPFEVTTGNSSTGKKVVGAIALAAMVLVASFMFSLWDRFIDAQTKKAEAQAQRGLPSNASASDPSNKNKKGFDPSTAVAAEDYKPAGNGKDLQNQAERSTAPPTDLLAQSPQPKDLLAPAEQPHHGPWDDFASTKELTAEEFMRGATKAQPPRPIPEPRLDPPRLDNECTRQAERNQSACQSAASSSGSVALAELGECARIAIEARKRCERVAR